MIPVVANPKERIAKRIAAEFNGTDSMMAVNAGIGIPTLVTTFITNPHVYIETENGMLGAGPLAKPEEVDDLLVDAGKQHITETKGCSFFSSADSFAMIRGGHLDATIIGAFQVDQEGSIANWIVPGGIKLGVGGAMDLIAGAKKVYVAMQHVGKNNTAKILKKCTFPLTGYQKVSMLVTEFAVFTFENGKMTLEEIANDITMEDLKSITEAEFEVSPNLKTFGD